MTDVGLKTHNHADGKSLHFPRLAAELYLSCPAKRGRGAALRQQCGGRGAGLTAGVGVVAPSTALRAVPLPRYALLRWRKRSVSGVAS